MKSKSELMRERRKALIDAGLVKSEVWHYPKHKKSVMSYDKRHTIKKGKE